jgi:hypothetical protein
MTVLPKRRADRSPDRTLEPAGIMHKVGRKLASGVWRFLAEKAVLRPSGLHLRTATYKWETSAVGVSLEERSGYERKTLDSRSLHSPRESCLKRAAIRAFFRGVFRSLYCSLFRTSILANDAPMNSCLLMLQYWLDLSVRDRKPALTANAASSK